MHFFRSIPTDLIAEDQCLPGRESPILGTGILHEVLGTPLHPPFPEGSEVFAVGMGCFWGAERVFWKLPGTVVTAVGYAGGVTPNPTYEEVCSGRTRHTEAVLVVFDPTVVERAKVLQAFWEHHDPTQGMRQGNDVGSQYRSAVLCTSEDQLAEAHASAESFGERLLNAGYGPITTEIGTLEAFFYAEEYHQQYLHKNPNGYCGLGGTGVSCPIGVAGVE